MRYTEASHALKTERLVSLDALRGFNFVWILGGDSAVLALAHMLRSGDGWASGIGGVLHDQMTHAAWEGFRFYDLIFPLFIFVTGVSIVLALPALVAREGRKAAHLRAIRRALVLYVLGLIYYGGISGHWADIRWLGVLQRIGICYLAAGLLFLNVGRRGLVVATIALLVGYWALMSFVPVPGIGKGSFAPDANLANWIDAHYLPGRLWDDTRDPEGLLSTLPAIATCLFGVLSGMILREQRLSPVSKSLVLFGGGTMLLAVGYLWAIQFPIVKAMWTSSFVLVAAGYSAIALGAMHQIIDVWGAKRWATVFVWIGANAITLYLLNQLMGFYHVAERLTGGDFAQLLENRVAPGAGWLLTSLTAFALVVALARFLYRRKIFVRV
jgi:predicted acyltransferase